jgi:membrane-associated phospholipid phosphatase
MQPIVQFIKSRQYIFSRRNIVIAILFAIGLTLFLSIYDGVKEQEDLASYDAPLLAWAISSYNPTLAAAMRVVSELSSPVALSIVTLVGASLWAWRKKDYWRPTLFVFSMTLAYITSAAIKVFTARERPTATDLLESHAAISYSFPSGHTLGIAVFLFVLGYFFCVAAPTLRRVILWGVTTAIGITLVAFSRIYLGYHWLTDVTASVGLAFTILASTIAIDTYVSARVRRKVTSKEA